MLLTSVMGSELYLSAVCLFVRLKEKVPDSQRCPATCTSSSPQRWSTGSRILGRVWPQRDPQPAWLIASHWSVLPEERVCCRRKPEWIWWRDVKEMRCFHSKCEMQLEVRSCTCDMLHYSCTAGAGRTLIRVGTLSEPGPAAHPSLSQHSCW